MQGRKIATECGIAVQHRTWQLSGSGQHGFVSSVIRYLFCQLFGSHTGVDARSKGPLLSIETPSIVWPPPRRGHGSALDSSARELEAPLLNPPTPSLPLATSSAADDCFLDEIDTQVGWSIFGVNAFDDPVFLFLSGLLHWQKGSCSALRAFSCCSSFLSACILCRPAVYLT